MLPRANRFLASLGDEIDALRSDLSPVFVRAGQTLCEPGEPIRTVYFPHAGAVSKLVAFLDGSEIECVLVGREGAVGANSTLGFKAAFTRDVCHVEMAATAISVARLQAACQDSSRLREAFQQYCTWKMSCAIRNGACNGRHSTEQRLCRSLLSYADVLESPEIRLSQDHFAKMLGAQRTTVNPILQRFRSKGLVALDRARLTILDRAGLMARACECYEVNRASRGAFIQAELTT